MTATPAEVTVLRYGRTTVVTAATTLIRWVRLDAAVASGWGAWCTTVRVEAAAGWVGVASAAAFASAEDAAEEAGGACGLEGFALMQWCSVRRWVRCPPETAVTGMRPVTAVQSVPATNRSAPQWTVQAGPLRRGVTRCPRTHASRPTAPRFFELVVG